MAPAVLEAIEHRGPDDYGWLRSTCTSFEGGREWTSPKCEPAVLLLHRRLSIIDTTRAGAQPMRTSDGRYDVVYNGEIYNYLELREELKQLGHTFRSHSDTEVLLAAYAEWGVDAFRRFVGMFAIALLDTKLRTVLLVRDFFGIKPLYLWQADGCLCFGSEIKALNAFGLSTPHANPERLLLYLRYGVTDFGSETMLKEVQQIPPAHYATISIDTGLMSEPQRYWSASTDGELDISFEEAASQVRELFLKSMQLHLRSDVAVGSALSGGVDSSAIVMAIRHLDPKAEIHAFSFIPDDGAPSEEKWIDIVVKESGATVHKIKTNSSELAADFDAMMQAHDEPFGSTSAYAQYLVFRAAKQAGVKVMLDGQGADELLGGYDVYKGARLASLLRAGEWSKAGTFLRGEGATTSRERYLRLAFSADYLLAPGLQSAARSLIGKEAFPKWLKRDWFDDREAARGYSNYTPARQVLHASLDQSVRQTLPALLRYEDRNSMAWSVESRVPFLTPDLANFLRRLPESYLIDAQGRTKMVFREAMQGIVPSEILDRRDKVGFATPERRWLDRLDPWVRSALASETARKMKFFDLDAAERELAQVKEGKRPFGFHIWRWVNLIRWSESFGVVFD